MKTPKANGAAPEPRKVYNLTKAEREHIAALNGEQIKAQRIAQDFAAQKNGALQMICRQQGLTGNYTLTDDFTMLSPVEEPKPAAGPQPVVPPAEVPAQAETEAIQ